MQTGGRDDHGLCLPAYLMHGHIPEMLQHDGCLLRNVVRMQRFKFLDCLDTRSRIELRIIGNCLGDFIIHVVSHVILQDIKNEMLLYGLSHGIDVERMIDALLVFPAEHVQSLTLRGRRECEK